MATDLSDRRAHLTNLEDYPGRQRHPRPRRPACGSRTSGSCQISRSTWPRDRRGDPGTDGADRVPPGAAADESGDAEAWRIWRTNGGRRPCWSTGPRFTMGRSAMMVGPVDPGSAPHSSRRRTQEVIVRHDPPRRRRGDRCALNCTSTRDAGLDRAVFFPSPDGWSRRPVRASGRPGSGSERLHERLDDSTAHRESGAHRSPSSVPQPRPASTAPRGEFEAHLAALDRLTFHGAEPARSDDDGRSAGASRACRTWIRSPVDHRLLRTDFLNGPGLWQLPAAGDLGVGSSTSAPILQAGNGTSSASPAPRRRRSSTCSPTTAADPPRRTAET